MMKTVVFLMRHYRKDKKEKYLAYTQTFADIAAPILMAIVALMISLDIDIFASAKSKTEEYLLAFLYYLFPFGVLYYILYPPKKIIKNYRKYKYPKYYIWYLRAIFIGTIFIIVLWAIFRQRT